MKGPKGVAGASRMDGITQRGSLYVPPPPSLASISAFRPPVSGSQTPPLLVPLNLDNLHPHTVNLRLRWRMEGYVWVRQQGQMVGWHHRQVPGHPLPQANGIAGSATRRLSTEESRGYGGGTSCSQPPGCEHAVSGSATRKSCCAQQRSKWAREGVEGSRPAAGWWQTQVGCAEGLAERLDGGGALIPGAPDSASQAVSVSIFLG